MLPLGRDVMLGMDSTGMFTKLSTVSYFSFAGALLTVLVEWTPDSDETEADAQDNRCSF